MCLNIQVFEKYSDIGSVVRTGPKTKRQSALLTIKDGKIRKMRAVAKAAGDSWRIQLIVTSIPLRKKKNLTARDPL